MGLELLLFVVAVVVICGALAMLIQKAPIDATIKQWGVWVIIAIGILILIFRIAPLVGLS